VPYRHVHQEVWICATATTVEVQLVGKRIAAHARNTSGRPTTLPDHMPSSHRAHAEWTPSRILGWASKLGPSALSLCQEILVDRPPVFGSNIRRTERKLAFSVEDIVKAGYAELIGFAAGSAYDAPQRVRGRRRRHACCERPRG
jgi:hypothetical protein